ncbi:MAG: CHC2 zinc finger domain-containing protein [Eubacteriales bacterium]|nr:CHC2 zinc finger domain-containing protein [Eubacteriales bacterium]
MKELSVFERCRGIPALEVARREGLALKQRGSRHWANCPLHGEKTPSMMFDDRGRWHCFGCGRGGDAVALLSALRGISPLQAARMLAQGRPAPPPDPRAAQRGRALKLKARADQWHKAQWDAACRKREQAHALADALAPGTQAFYHALASLSAEETKLDALMSLSPLERLREAETHLNQTTI